MLNANMSLLTGVFRSPLSSSALVALAFLTGCGSAVDDGSGGNASTSATNATVASASSSSSSSSGNPACKAHCASAATKGCPLTDCESTCDQGAGPMNACATQQAAMLACHDAPGTDCHNTSNDCYSQELQYSGCLAQSSKCGGANQCSGSSDGCHCTIDCNPTMYDSQCTVNAGVISCDCSKNGTVFGHCTETQQSGLSCEYFAGCCAILSFPSN